MRIAKQYWQKFVSLLRKITTPRSRQVEHELSALRHDHRELDLRASTLASEADTAHKTLEMAKQQIESIQVRLGEVYKQRSQLTDEFQKQMASLKTEMQEVRSGHNRLIKELDEHDRRLETVAANTEAPLVSLQAELEQLQSEQSKSQTRQAEHDRQLEALETATEAQRLREQQLLAGISSLEQRSTEAEHNQRSAKDENQALAVQLAGIQSAFETSESNNSKQLADLALHLGDLEAERASTRDRLQALQNSLTDQASRHSDTQRTVRALEGELEGDRKQQRERLDKVEEKLTRLQIEQESLINTQSGLTDSLRKNRRWATAAVSIVFLIAVLAGVMKIHDVQRDVPELAAVSDATEPTSEAQVSGQQKPPLEEPSPLTVEAVESAALETDIKPVENNAPRAEKPADNATEPTPDDPSSNTDKDAAAKIEPLINEIQPIHDQPGNSNTEAAADAPPNREKIGQIEKLERPPESSADAAVKPLLTAGKTIEAAQPFEANAFFEENARKNGVVSLPSGLQYKILRSGRGKMPGEMDMVVLHYRGSLPDGREFDSSYTGKAPAAYRVDQVIAGWREALLRMQEGAQWELYIPPELAHGTDAQETPGFFPLIYQIELIAVSKADESR